MTKKEERERSRGIPSRRRNGSKRKDVAATLDELQIDPVKALIRVAMKAEDAKQYGVARSAWGDIISFLQPRFKAVDPLEQAERASKIMNISELQAIKEAILSGDYSEVQDALPKPVPEAVEVQSLL